MKIITYLRVSTEDQTLAPQRLELNEWAARVGATVETEYSDVISGGTAARPGLDALLERCARGGIDAVLAVKIDRLGRSVLNVVGLIERLEKMGVGVICPGQGIDTRKDNPCGRMQYQIIAAVAEFEKSMIRERTKAGLRVARANGKVLGRPSVKAVPVEQRAGVISQWKIEGGVGVRELAARLGGVSIATAAKWAKEPAYN